MIGTSFSSIFTLIGILIVTLLMQIPFGGIQIVRLILVIPVFCLVGASLGLFFIGFVRDPKVAQMGAMLICMPQMLMAGTIIPISNSSGIIAFLAKIMPLTYLTDFARGVFYWGKLEYHSIVIYNPAINIIASMVFFVFFSVVGTILFTRNERNR